MGAHEIADRLGVSRQRAYRIIASYDDFPKPAAELAIGRVWRAADVERWIQQHEERPPGRPVKADVSLPEQRREQQRR